jgi:hypothetical protein
MDPKAVNENAANGNPQDPGRRRLLKAGAVAGPLVMTLRGGGGWVGSGTRCDKDKWGRTVEKKKLSEACLVSLGFKPKNGSSWPSW